MEENKEKKISITTFVISLIIMISIIIGLVFYIFYNKRNNRIENVNVVANNNLYNIKENTNNNSISDKNINNETTKNTNAIKTETKKEVKDYFILYKGYEMKKDTGVQNLSDMIINDENNEKYNTNYYNYEKGKYLGETEGSFGEETYEGVSIVSNVKRIAISQKYDAIPRVYSKINTLPKE